MANIWLGLVGTASLVLGGTAHAQTVTPAAATATPLTGCPSARINALFSSFGDKGAMQPDLGRWLNDPTEQITQPYQAFDGVYNVGICWVSAWVIKTSAGLVLIDTLYAPYTDQLLKNMTTLGLNPADIKLVLVTHGHFDHAGGITQIKALTNARIAMTQTGWNEAQTGAHDSVGKANAWTMPAAPDLVLKDGDVLSVGGTKIEVYETPGHTWGTASFAFDVTDRGKPYRAIVIGGLGLNAIDGAGQVAAYLASVDRISALVRDPAHPITVNLATHPFSSGLTEAKDRLKTRRAGALNPLVDQPALLAQLATLRAGAVKRLALEQARPATVPR